VGWNDHDKYEEMRKVMSRAKVEMRAARGKSLEMTIRSNEKMATDTNSKGKEVPNEVRN
jgi:hypothetical protein